MVLALPPRVKKGLKGTNMGTKARGTRARQKVKLITLHQAAAAVPALELIQKNNPTLIR